jgi:hypothetical protein
MYHCSVKIISRSAGRSATGAAAYRAGVSLKDEITGEIHDYRRKKGIEHAEIVLPHGVQLDRNGLWNAAELADTRKNSRVAREYELALPVELTPEQRKNLALEFARHLVSSYGVAADVSLHEPNRKGDQRNYHAHILTTTRQVTPEGFGAKTRVLDDGKSGPVEVERVRAAWAELTNQALERAGHETRVSHKSLEAQGIDRIPTVHLGAAASAMERRGIRTDLGDENREARAIEAERASIAAQEAQEAAQEAQREAERERKARESIETQKAQERANAREKAAPEAAKAPDPGKVAREDALLKDAGVYGKTASEAWGRLHVAEEAMRLTDVALFHAKKEAESHNRECDEMSFIQRTLNTGRINKRAGEIEEKLKLCIDDHTKALETVAKLEKAHSILAGRDREAREQYEQSPEGKAEKARLEAERQRKLQEEKQRQQARSRGPSMGR